MSGSSNFQNLLRTVFSTRAGSSEEEIAEYLIEPFMQPGSPLGDTIRAELMGLYQDPNTDWMKLLEEGDAYTAPSTEEARDFVTKNIWNALFPDRKDAPPGPNA